MARNLELLLTVAVFNELFKSIKLFSTINLHILPSVVVRKAVGDKLSYNFSRCTKVVVIVNTDWIADLDVLRRCQNLITKNRTFSFWNEKNECLKASISSVIFILSFTVISIQWRIKTHQISRQNNITRASNSMFKQQLTSDA